MVPIDVYLYAPRTVVPSRINTFEGLSVGNMFRSPRGPEVPAHWESSSRRSLTSLIAAIKLERIEPEIFITFRSILLPGKPSRKNISTAAQVNSAICQTRGVDCRSVRQWERVWLLSPETWWSLDRVCIILLLRTSCRGRHQIIMREDTLGSRIRLDLPRLAASQRAPGDKIVIDWKFWVLNRCYTTVNCHFCIDRACDQPPEHEE